MNTRPDNIEYYRDGDRWVASLNRGSEGFFVHTTGQKNWNYVTPGSVRWDALHQNLYRTFHDYEFCLDGWQELPELPPIPVCNSIDWKDNFLPETNLSAENFPNVAAYLQASLDKKMQVWIVLKEDQYETICDDGCFRYFKGKVYRTEADAELAASTPDIGYTNTIATLVIGIDGTAIVPRVFMPGPFDHYNFEEVVKTVEDSIDILL